MIVVNAKNIRQIATNPLPNPVPNTLPKDIWATFVLSMLNDSMRPI